MTEKLWVWTSCILLSALTALAPAQPTAISITGHLLDSANNPITGTRDYNVTFHDAEIDGNQLGSARTGSVAPSDKGMFHISVEPTAEALAADAVWYALSIDSDTPTDGIDANDSFPERVAIGAVPFALKARQLKGLEALDSTCVSVEVTDDPVQNGLNLQTAYFLACSLTPNGEAISGTNRAVCIVPPGNYDLGSTPLVLYKTGVDLIGLTTDRAAQRIYGLTNGVDTGVLMQSASDIRIENLTVECHLTGYSLAGDSTDPAAYRPDNDLSLAVIVNCHFGVTDVTSAYPTRAAIIYSGRFERVETGDYGFGAYGGTASGVFIDCVGDDYCFAYQGTASGSFDGCVADSYSFASRGTASGSFNNCKAGTAGFGGYIGGTASGNFRNCEASNYSFGGRSTASGDFYHCTGGTYSFGGGSGGEATGRFWHCTGNSYCFGGSLGATGAEFYHCVGETGAFGGGGETALVYCVRNGVAYP